MNVSNTQVTQQTNQQPVQQIQQVPKLQQAVQKPVKLQPQDNLMKDQKGLADLKQEKLADLVNPGAESEVQKAVEKIDNFLTTLPPDMRDQIVDELVNISNNPNNTPEVDKLAQDLAVIGDDPKEIDTAINTVLTRLNKNVNNVHLDKKESKISKLGADQLAQTIKRLPEDTVKKISPEKSASILKQLDTNNIKNMEPKKLALLIAKIDDKELSKLAPEKLGTILKILDISTMNANKTGIILEKMKSDDINNLEPAKISEIIHNKPSEQLRKLDPEKLANIINKVPQIQTNVEEALKKLEPEKLANVIKSLPAGSMDKLATLLNALGQNAPEKLANVIKNLPSGKDGIDKLKPMLNEMSVKTPKFLADVITNLSTGKDGMDKLEPILKEIGQNSPNKLAAVIKELPSMDKIKSIFQGLTEKQMADTINKLDANQSEKIGVLLKGLPEQKLIDFIKELPGSADVAKLKTVFKDSDASKITRIIQKLDNQPEKIAPVLQELEPKKIAAIIEKMPKDQTQLDKLTPFIKDLAANKPEQLSGIIQNLTLNKGSFLSSAKNETEKIFTALKDLDGPQLANLITLLPPGKNGMDKVKGMLEGFDPAKLAPIIENLPQDQMPKLKGLLQGMDAKKLTAIIKDLPKNETDKLQSALEGLEPQKLAEIIGNLPEADLTDKLKPMILNKFNPDKAGLVLKLLTPQQITKFQDDNTSTGKLTSIIQKLTLPQITALLTVTQQKGDMSAIIGNSAQNAKQLARESSFLGAMDDLGTLKTKISDFKGEQTKLEKLLTLGETGGITKETKNKLCADIKILKNEIKSLESIKSTMERLATLNAKGTNATAKEIDEMRKLENKMAGFVKNMDGDVLSVMDEHYISKADEALRYLSVSLFEKDYKDLYKLVKPIDTNEKDVTKLTAQLLSAKSGVDVPLQNVRAELAKLSQDDQLSIERFVILNQFKTSNSPKEFFDENIGELKTQLKNLGFNVDRPEISGTKKKNEGLLASDALSVKNINSIITQTEKSLPVSKNTNIKSIVDDIKKDSKEPKTIAHSISNAIWSGLTRIESTVAVEFDRMIKVSAKVKIPVVVLPTSTVGIGIEVEHDRKDSCLIRKNEKGEHEIELYQGTKNGGHLSSSFNLIDGAVAGTFSAGAELKVGGSVGSGKGIKLVFEKLEDAMACLTGILMKKLDRGHIEGKANIETIEGKTKSADISLSVSASAGFGKDAMGDGAADSPIGMLFGASASASIGASGDWQTKIYKSKDGSTQTVKQNTTEVTLSGEIGLSGPTLDIDIAKRSGTPDSNGKDRSYQLNADELLPGIKEFVPKPLEKGKLSGEKKLYQITTQYTYSQDRAGNVKDGKMQLTFDIEAAGASKRVLNLVPEGQQRDNLRQIIEKNKKAGITQITVSFKMIDPTKPPDDNKNYALSSVAFKKSVDNTGDNTSRKEKFLRLVPLLSYSNNKTFKAESGESEKVVFANQVLDFLKKKGNIDDTDMQKLTTALNLANTPQPTKEFFIKTVTDMATADLHQDKKDAIIKYIETI